MKNYIVYSDFSDTIVKPSVGDKFPPFELELAKFAGINLSDPYEHFVSIRRDDSIPYEERMKIWLKPFIGLLTQQHIERLVSTFSYNENYNKAVELVKEKLRTDSLEIIIVSGTLWQIIDTFLKGKTAFVYLKESGITFKMGATKIHFNKDGKYDGQLIVTDKLAFAPASSFPNQCLVIGDNAMEKYGFGERLLNVQTYNPQLIAQQVDSYLSLV
ncbi:MAG TPA: hypothetical protein VMW41_04390 [Candidatus Bathyarchaeia archaeon]|nr:hypothetical protein [Candidatus Bathyarchaeia archaeon]